MNRKFKRAEKAHHKREMKKATWDSRLEDKTEGYREKLIAGGVSPRNLLFFKHNKILSIIGFEFEDVTILAFRRNTSDTDIPWSVKFHFKNLIGYEDRWAYEAYPALDKVVDQRNMYWLMIPKVENDILDLRNYTLFPSLGVKENGNDLPSLQW